MEKYVSNKNFRLWDYVVSHDQLLFRHDNFEKDQNIDIIFLGVFYVESITMMLNGIIIEDPTKEEETYLHNKSGKQKKELPDYKFYVLIANNKRFYIGASFCYVFENNLPWAESSLGFKENQGNLIYSNINPAAIEYQRINGSFI